MADKVLLKQVESDLHKTNKTDLFAYKSAAHDTPLVMESVVIPPNGAISDNSFGSKIAFNIPQVKYVSACLVVNIGTAPTNGFYDEIGLSLVEQLQVKDGGSTIVECNNTDACADAIGLLPYEAQVKLAALMGGSSFTTGQFIVPLALPWDRVLNPDVKPFDARGASKNLDLNVTLRALSTLTNSNVATSILTSIKLHCFYIVDNSPIPKSFKYQCLDYQSMAATTMATGTSTSVDLSSFTGDIAYLTIFDRLTSDLAASVADYGAPQDDVTELKVLVDGKEVYNNGDSFKVSHAFANLTNHSGRGHAGVFGDATRVTFSYSPHPNVYSGALPIDKFRKVTFK